MGKTFGHLYKLHRIVYVSLSPFEQKAFVGMFPDGIINTIRRCKDSFFYVVPPLLTGYIVYDQVEKEHARLQRKNPADYANDK